MTAEEWRTVGRSRWRDSLAALEDTKSPAFMKRVEVEEEIWARATAPLSQKICGWQKRFQYFQQAAYPQTRAYAPVKALWNGLTIRIQAGVAGYTQNIWIETKSGATVWSCKGVAGFGWDEGSRLFYVLEDIGSGAETLEVHVQELTAANKVKSLWKRSPVGPNIIFHDQFVYYLGVENALRYHEIWRCDARTGAHQTCLLTEDDKRIQLALFDCNGSITVLAANAIFQRLGVIEPGPHHGVKWVTDVQKSTLIPICKGIYASNRHLHIYSQKIVTPNPELHISDASVVSKTHGKELFIVCTQNGAASLWLFKIQSHEWISLLNPRCICSIEIVHEKTEFPTFLLHRPSVPETVFEFRPIMGLVETLQLPCPLKLQTLAEGFAGTAPFVVVSHIPRPTALLVDAYGAYGISSRRAYPMRWLPYLERGYAVVLGCPRGGREKGDEWWDASRGAVRKSRTFSDTAAILTESQRLLGIPPQRTIFFGRSAGGWLAAQIAQTYGNLVGAVYAEVPYVDVLRTTTNPALPLTQLEYDEFGDPLHRPSEFRALRKISPVDTVPQCRDNLGCPTIVVRTGLHDMQVLPYEALKWAVRLREKKWPHVFVGIDRGSGHFAPAADMNQQRAEDAAILDQAIQRHALAQETQRSRDRRKSTKRSDRSATEIRGSKTRRRRRSISRTH